MRRTGARIALRILGVLLALTPVVAATTAVLAVPQLPERYQGSVTINGRTAPAGVRLSARMSGVAEQFSTTTDGQGNYSLLYVKGDDLDTGQREGGVNGDAVQFFVGAAHAASSTFTSGASTTLNLNVTIRGDATSDGEINALDITKVERVVASLDPENPGADANADGQFNAIDITKVERLIAGLD